MCETERFTFQAVQERESIQLASKLTWLLEKDTAKGSFEVRRTLSDVIFWEESEFEVKTALKRQNMQNCEAFLQKLRTLCSILRRSSLLTTSILSSYL